MTSHISAIDNPPSTSRWGRLADEALAGRPLGENDGLAILRSPDAELLDVLAAAYRVRHRWFGNRVHLNFLVNAKSGQCGEDCGYCSQSRVSTAPIERYALLDPSAIVDGARVAAERRAGTYCIVISGRTPAERDLETITGAVTRIKQQWGLRICVSCGLLDDQQAARLKAAGVNRINHNLNTSRRFYPRVCSTHSYDQRLETVETVRRAGLELCSGGIVGMGEDEADVVELALTLGHLRAEAVPVNFLLPIAGTPLAGVRRLDPRYCLKVLALFRLANPRGELRIAAGREVHLGSLQPLGLFAASSIFVGDYLTTPGQPPDDDYRMIADLGFEAVPEGSG